MHLPKGTQFAEVTALDNELNELSNRITSIKADINNRGKLQNDANIIKARHTGYQPQSIYDEADKIYHAEGAAIGLLKRELQPLERRYGELYKERGELYNHLMGLQYLSLERETQTQYEGETVKGNLAKIVKLSKAIIEQDAKLGKLRLELSALDKIANDQNECQAGHDRYKAEYLVLKQELEQAEAAYTLDASMSNPIGLRKRVAESKKKYDYTVKHLPSQVLLDSIAEKRCILLGEVANIESEKKELDADRWAKRSLIAEIQYRENIPKLLNFVKTMIACDIMSNGKSNVGRELFNRLQNTGLTPRIFINSLSVFEGLLDNLDEEKARVNAEFNDNLTL
jgi:hypothetical protein